MTLLGAGVNVKDKMTLYRCWVSPDHSNQFFEEKVLIYSYFCAKFLQGKAYSCIY